MRDRGQELTLEAVGLLGARERSLVAGCDGYITKPIDPRQLPQQLQEFIAGRRDALPQAVEAPLLREYNHKLVERLERQVRDLQAANVELQELDQLKSQFLATLSHELRTPLTSILGYLDLFDRGTLGALTEVQKHAIEVIARNALTLTRQLNNLLYLQEVRSSQIKRVPVMIYDMVLRLALELQPLAQEAGVNLIALSIRLRRACSSAIASPGRLRVGCSAISSVTPASCASGCSSSASRSTMS